MPDKPGRLLAKAAFINRRCANCKHFSLEAGAAAMKRSPAFFAAAEWLSPDEMGGKPHELQEQEVLDESTGEKVKVQVSVPGPKNNTGTQWADIGVCNKHNEGRSQHDKCQDWA